jgi:hypothetical protein
MTPPIRVSWGANPKQPPAADWYISCTGEDCGMEIGRRLDNGHFPPTTCQHASRQKCRHIVAKP